MALLFHIPSNALFTDYSIINTIQPEQMKWGMVKQTKIRGAVSNILENTSI
jgi:hypothetical protein